MAEELPDWLAEMRDQQLGQQLEEGSTPPEQVVEDIVENLEGQEDLEDVFQSWDQPDQIDAPPDQAGQEDVLDGLREQMALAEEEFEQEEKASLAHAFLGLQPGQRLVLTVLLFLDVALCGCMALVMAGRVGLPF